MNCATSSAAANDLQSDTQCGICGGIGVLHWKDRSSQRPLEPEDLRITDHRYGTTLSLVRCGECGFIFSNDKEVDELVSLYEKMSAPGYEEGQQGRDLQLSKARKASPSTRSLLDVGAGSGLLVAEAKCFGFNTIGVEPSSGGGAWTYYFQIFRSHNVFPLVYGLYLQYSAATQQRLAISGRYVRGDEQPYTYARGDGSSLRAQSFPQLRCC